MKEIAWLQCEHNAVLSTTEFCAVILLTLRPTDRSFPFKLKEGLHLRLKLDGVAGSATGCSLKLHVEEDFVDSEPQLPLSIACNLGGALEVGWARQWDAAAPRPFRRMLAWFEAEVAQVLCAAMQLPVHAAKSEADAEWSAAQQAQLEEAFALFPASLGANARWASIGEHVEGKTKAQCVARYKAVRAALQAEKASAPT